MPDPAIVTAALSLSLEAREALAAQPGPGWWVHLKGGRWGCPHPEPAESSDEVDWRLPRGWAWLPADPLAWLRAACPEGGAWGVDCGATEPHTETAWIEGPGDTPRFVLANTAQECALRWWGVLP